MLEDTFQFETYIVLDVPSPVAEAVMAVREKHRDVFRASLPTEITIAGSSGVGVLSRGQSPKEVYRLLDQIAAKTAPIEAAFGTVLRFPGTDIFVLTLANETPFQRLHNQVAASGILFKESPFPYKPHCTLRSRSPVSDHEVTQLLEFTLPGTFLLQTMSVYRMRRLPMDLLHRTTLSG
ncbi:MAG: 2'-5' RNA ligase family protein [Chloroflexi bacterium]|nr:2'-5' RNA ligase family protein [Chloroflexota bacterium]